MTPVDASKLAVAIEKEPLVNQIADQVEKILANAPTQLAREIEETWEGPPKHEPLLTLYEAQIRAVRGQAEAVTLLLAGARSLAEDIDTARKAQVKPLNDQVKAINERFKELTAPLGVLADKLGARIRQLQHIETDLTNAERKRVEAINREKEAAAKAAAAADPTAEVKATTLHEVPPPPAPTTLRTAAGTSYEVTVKKVEVRNLEAVCAAVMRKELPAAIFTIDTDAVLKVEDRLQLEKKTLDWNKHGLRVVETKETRFRRGK